MSAERQHQIQVDVVLANIFLEMLTAIEEQLLISYDKVVAEFAIDT